ncbi:MAG: hypothetical protein QNJ20_15710 [Paracoccaceae bacterium]|nr:hypothetical protein [Paracoccaceae bacterium]
MKLLARLLLFWVFSLFIGGAYAGASVFTNGVGPTELVMATR